jgi:cold shock protein
MSSEDSVGTTPLVIPTDRIVGRVKWFNNKAGYGFITVSSGNTAGSDVFVHHSGIQVGNEQYKYLVQGEYVSFNLVNTQGGAHSVQAADVSGINGGKLMCETRREFRQTRVSYKTSDKSDVDEDVKVAPPKSTRPPKSDDTPRVRGSGPREGGEWTMVEKEIRPKNPSQAKRGRPPRATKQ